VINTHPLGTLDYQTTMDYSRPPVVVKGSFLFPTMKHKRTPIMTWP